MKKQITFEIFDLKTAFGLRPSFQIILITFLFLLITVWSYYVFGKTGNLFSGYQITPILFAPIYEEIIFRGFLLIILNKIFSLKKAFLISCFLFGVWHLKNIFFLTNFQVVRQMLYAGFIAGPIFTWSALKAKSIWPAVILHYLNNLISLMIMPIVISYFV